MTDEDIRREIQFQILEAEERWRERETQRIIRAAEEKHRPKQVLAGFLGLFVLLPFVVAMLYEGIRAALG